MCAGRSRLCLLHEPGRLLQPGRRRAPVRGQGDGFARHDRPGHHLELDGRHGRAVGAAITSAPRSQTNSRTAIVAFHGSETGLSFSCRLDGGAFAACGSPISYGNLADGAHSFTVRSKDAAGNVGPAAARGWVVDTRPPHTSITGTPPNVSSTASATFAFASSEASSFSCSLDGGAFSACSSPRSYGGLLDGGHTFRVRATDLAGNADPAPPAYSWQVLALLPPDTTPPGKVKRLKVAVRYGFLRSAWLPPADTDLDHVQIQRRRSPTGGSETTVYQGRGRKYTDRRFENGSYFMYRVRSYDGAGNASRAANVPVSPAALLTAPRDGRVVRGSIQLAWAAVPRAGYYNVQLYRGAQKLLSAWPAKARLALAKRWVYQSRRFRLAKGFYRWYVWPGFGARLQAKYGTSSARAPSPSAEVEPLLRDVAESDLDAFYQQQLDPEATAMALFPARDREAFDAHWRRVLADDSAVKRTIVDDGAVAGHVALLGAGRAAPGRLLAGARVLGARARERGPGRARGGAASPAAARLGRRRQRRLHSRAPEVRLRRGRAASRARRALRRGRRGAPVRAEGLKSRRRPAADGSLVDERKEHAPRLLAVGLVPFAAARRARPPHVAP